MSVKSPESLEERREAIRIALGQVPDPEIPIVSVMDLGMIGGVEVTADAVVIDLLPTFAACPALEMIREQIASAVRGTGEEQVDVRVLYHPPWSTDRITEEGRRKLKSFGLGPPQTGCGGARPAPVVPCPYCESDDTVLESLFGPTLCRAIHYCHACRQSFEQFKTV